MSSVRKAAKQNGSKQKTTVRASSRSSRKRKLFAAIAIVLTLLACFACLLRMDTSSFKDCIHYGVRVGGVDVGGMSLDDAAAVLQYELDCKLSAAKTGVLVEDREWIVDASTVQASVDGQRLAQEAYAFGREEKQYLKRLKAWLGGIELHPVLDFDPTSISDLIAKIEASYGSPAVDASVLVSGAVVTCVNASDGLAVNEATLRAKLSDALLLAQQSFELALEKTQPRIQDSEAQEIAQIVRSAISQPVNLRYREQTWTLSSIALGNCIEVQQQKSAAGYSLVPIVEQAALESLLKGFIGDTVIVAPQDAYFLADSESKSISIVPSVNGAGPDVAAIASLLQELLFADGSSFTERLILCPDAPLEADFSTEDAQAMGIEGLISEYTTYYSGGAAKGHNIKTLCELLDYSLVAPGETWSLNGNVGECNEDKGFQAAGSIVNGVYTTEIGGGICQVATTLFNAVLESGFPVIERSNHSLYLASYPEGRDATISYPSPDFKFKNDSDSYLLITASYDAEKVLVMLWGSDPGYSVDIQTGEWQYEGAHSSTVVQDDSLPAGERIVVSEGRDASYIAITRSVYDSEGNLLHRDVFSSHYKAVSEVVHEGTKEV